MKYIKLLMLVMIFVFVLCSCGNLGDTTSNNNDSDNESGTVLSDGAILFKEGKLDSDTIVEFKDENSNVLLNNDDLISVYAKFSDINSYYIEFEMTENGSGKFATATRENIGRTISICVDGEVVSAPTVQSEILGDRVVVSNCQSYEELLKMFEKLT